MPKIPPQEVSSKIPHMNSQTGENHHARGHCKTLNKDAALQREVFHWPDWALPRHCLRGDEHRNILQRSLQPAQIKMEPILLGNLSSADTVFQPWLRFWNLQRGLEGGCPPLPTTLSICLPVKALTFGLYLHPYYQLRHRCQLHVGPRAPSRPCCRPEPSQPTDTCLRQRCLCRNLW